MARAKASTWRPRGLELVSEVSGLYADKQMRSIVGLIGDFSDHRDRIIADKILLVAGWLNARLHYERAPAGPEMRMALVPLAARLAELRAAIDALDPHTRAALESEAAKAPPDVQTEPRNWPADYGPLRLERARRQQEQFEGWVQSTIAALPSGKRSRKAHEPFKEAAFYLVEIWKHVTPLPSRRKTPIEPTVSQLTNLLRASMRPVCAVHGADPKLTAAAKAVLDDGWRPEWRIFAHDWLDVT